MTYPLDVFVRAILTGRFASVKLPAPRWSPDAHDSLARRILASANREPLPDPRHVAVAVGHTLIPRAPHGLCGESCAPGVIAYDGCAEPKLRGALVMHGVSHQASRRHLEGANESDNWLLTAALLLPTYETHALSLSEIVARAHAPEWFVRCVMTERRGCFPELCE